MADEAFDSIVVGAGAAGLFAALAARGALRADGSCAAPGRGAPRVLLVDSQERVGRKILVSGGGRCNVTNASVTERDFDTGSPAVVRSVLAGFPPASVRAFFEGRGVPLAEEPLGKLFPRDGNARSVLDALLGAVRDAGVACAFGEEAGDIALEDGGWRVGARRARRAVIATGGKSLPQTGSTGCGYEIARGLGHALVPPVPALAPLHCAAPPGPPGVTVPAILSVEDGSGRARRRAAGSLLVTHKGVSGPAALDASTEVARRIASAEPFLVRADLWTLADPAGPFGSYLRLPKLPGACLADAPPPAGAGAVEEFLVSAARRSPRATVGAALAERVPRRLVEALVPRHARALPALSRAERRAAAEAMTALDLRVQATGGFDRAEVTAGGVPLGELDRRTLESRKAPGLHFCGEVCDATGRLGGFNFQWAWSSGTVAGRASAR